MLEKKSYRDPTFVFGIVTAAPIMWVMFVLYIGFTYWQETGTSIFKLPLTSLAIFTSTSLAIVIIAFLISNIYDLRDEIKNLMPFKGFHKEIMEAIAEDPEAHSAWDQLYDRLTKRSTAAHEKFMADIKAKHEAVTKE